MFPLSSPGAIIPVVTQPVAGPFTADSERQATIRELMPYFLGYGEVELRWAAGTLEKYEDVLAAAAGVVRQVGWDTPSNPNKGFGFFVSLYHSAYGQTTLYGHTTSLQQVVHVGDNVTRSQKIAVSGSTGVSTNPHLHFSVYDGDVMVTSAFPFSIDPQGWLGSGQDPWTRDKGYLFAVSPTSLSLFTTVSAGDITSSTTWLPGVYVINGTVTIDSGARLNINRDAVIKFQTSTSKLVVANGGILDAEGTASSNIYFTSYKDDSVGGDTNGDATSTTPAVGNWDNIQFDSGSSSTLAYAVARYGGNADCCGRTGIQIYNNGGTLTLSHSEVGPSNLYGVYQLSGTSTISSTNVHNVTYYGIEIDSGITTLTSDILQNNMYGLYVLGGNVTVNSNTFTNNTSGAADLNGFTAFTHSGNTSSGEINGFIMANATNQTWTASSDLPYVIPTGGCLVSGGSLTIKAGAVVKFQSGATLTIDSNNASLVTQGTSVSSVYFTSIKDDAVDNRDTGNDATSTPAASDWKTVYLIAGASSASFNYTTIHYGGASTYVSGIYNAGGTLTTSSSTIAYNNTYGIYQAAGSTTTTHSEIHH
jgi:hypothetical protein